MPIFDDRNLGFLFGDITRLLRERFNTTAASAGLTLAQGRALAYLSRHEGISQVALARLLEVTPITLLRQVDRLSDAGLVERRANPVDRRAQKLYPTEAARSLLQQLAIIGGSITETALAGLTPDERVRLYALLERVKVNLAEAEAPNTADAPDIPANSHVHDDLHENHPDNRHDGP
ncbi:MAG: MarR family winged helix-turn-helix transcriptional regulator [Gammaproteobacteria bacterium]